MINFGALPQPSTTFAAAPCLQAPQEPYVITRRGPKLPSDHACAVPDRILVGPSLPQIDMPAEAINWLPANTTKAGTLPIRAFPKGRRWILECRRQPVLAVVAQPPAPAAGRSATGDKRAPGDRHEVGVRPNMNLLRAVASVARMGG